MCALQKGGSQVPEKTFLSGETSVKFNIHLRKTEKEILEEKGEEREKFLLSFSTGRISSCFQLVFVFTLARAEIVLDQTVCFQKSSLVR